MNTPSSRWKCNVTPASFVLFGALCAGPVAGLAAPTSAAKSSASQVAPGAAVQTQPADRASNPPRAFDPSTCKGGQKGYVYWAARDQVFKFRFDPTIPLYPRLDSVLSNGQTLEEIKEIPSAPDPSAPQGCFKNPLRGGEVPYMEEFSERLHLSIFGQSKNKTTSHVRRTYYSELNKGLERISSNEFRINAINKISGCRLRNSGINECPTTNSNNFYDYSGNRMLLIKSHLISSNKNTPNVALSLWKPYHPKKSITNGVTIDMGGDFILFNSVYVYEAFVIWSNQIDLLIPYYSALIQYVTSAHVPHYAWTQAKAQPKTKPQ